MKRVVRILAIIYISYLALVLLVVTPALNLLPAWLAEKHLGRDFHSKAIWFNPFTVSLEARETALPEQDGTPFVSLDRATVDLSLASLWHPGLVFDELAVDQLYLNVVEKADGSFNFSNMLPPPDPQPEPEEPGAMPAVTIDAFNFNAQKIVFTREVGEKPSSTNLSDITIRVQGLSTVLEEGKPYILDASGDRGGKLHWEGEVSIPRSYSEGTLALNDIQLRPLWHFAESQLAFELATGTMSVTGQYKVDWSESLKYWISQGEISLDELAVKPQAPADLPDTEVALGSLKLAGIALDGQEQHLDIGALTISELAISGWSEGQEVSLVRLFEVDLQQDSGPPPPPVAEDTETDDAAWTAALGSFQLDNSSLRWRSEFTDPARLEVTPLEASTGSIKWPFEGQTPVKASLTINGQTSASVEGELELAKGTGSIAYQLLALPLGWFNPNFPEALNAEITGGQLDVSGQVALSEFAPVTIGLDGAITGFAGKVSQAETSLTSWETVRWEKLLIDLEKHRVELAKLSIDDFTGRLHINKDGSINASNVWQQEVGEEAEEVKEGLAEGEPWTVSAPLISISDSEIDFMDESLPIQFRTTIRELNGDIRGLSSQADARAKVDLKGSVDGYAPVTLAGTAAPLSTPPAIDLALTFTGVDMSSLSPYSGTYAGYAIERGVLNLDLQYAMQDNKLKGNNKIVIEQMKLGDKVPSEKAADLPLELALALLTDSNGVIDMEVPVSGDVNDPGFNIGSVVMGALGNLITTVVTSPFTLLASLVDSEEDLQRLNFSSGSTELDARTKEKLDNLYQALSQRPELNMVVTGRLQLEADRERLQKNLLQAELLAAGLSQAELSSKGPEWDKAIEARYQATSPGVTELAINDQYLALARAMPLSDADMLALASARAVAVKTYLVNEAGLGAERAAIAKPSLDKEVNRYSGVELDIDT